MASDAWGAVAQNANLDEAQNELQFFVSDLVHHSLFNKPESSECTSAWQKCFHVMQIAREAMPICLELLNPRAQI